MTTQLLFVQGAGQNVHDEWDNRLVDSLARELGDGYEIRYPRLPDEADARYAAWKPELLRELNTLPYGAVLVGHSVGGTILLHVLAEEHLKMHIAAIALIATPFIGVGGWPSDELEPRTDFGARLPEGTPIFLYHGTDDEIVPIDHLSLYARAIPQATIRVLDHRDHQLDNDLGVVARDIRDLNQSAPDSARNKRSD